MPTMSVGKRSGVNWILLNDEPVINDSVRMSSVFPSPGIPSKRTWPLHSIASISALTTACCPTIIFAISDRIKSKRSWYCSTSFSISSGLAPLNGSFIVLVNELSPLYSFLLVCLVNNRRKV